MGKPKILFVYNQDPYAKDFGGNLRVRYLFESAGHAGFKTELLSINSNTGHETEKKPFNRIADNIIHKTRALTYSKSNLELAHIDQQKNLRKQLLDKLRQTDFDIIQVEHSYLGASLMDVPTHAMKVLDFHNVHSFMDYPEAETNKIRSYESALSQHYNLALACSDIEANRLKELGFDHIRVVPNGVETAKVKPEDYVFSNPGLLFVGDMLYAPNRKAMQHFALEIAPLIQPNPPLNIVGRYDAGKPGSINTIMGVKLHGYKNQIGPFFRNSIFICPIRSGGGTRIKILTAFAYGLPVVSYPKGAEGINCKNNEHILLVDTPEEFARQIERLRSNPDLCGLMGKQARKLVEETYDWRNIGESFYKDLYEKVGY